MTLSRGLVDLDLPAASKSAIAGIASVSCEELETFKESCPPEVGGENPVEVAIFATWVARAH